MLKRLQLVGSLTFSAHCPAVPSFCFPVFQAFPPQLEPPPSCNPHTGLSREATSFHPGLLVSTSTCLSGPAWVCSKGLFDRLTGANTHFGLRSSGQISCLTLPGFTAIFGSRMADIRWRWKSGGKGRERWQSLLGSECLWGCGKEKKKQHHQGAL